MHCAIPLLGAEALLQAETGRDNDRAHRTPLKIVMRGSRPRIHGVVDDLVNARRNRRTTPSARVENTGHLHEGRDAAFSYRTT